MRGRVILAVLLGVSLSAEAASQELEYEGPLKETPFVIEFSEIAPNVWAGIRPDPHRHPVMGNTTFVVSEDGVVVFDGGGVAIMADKVIAKIRELTDAPVTHVITSHWHGDHNFGVYRFGEEYPDVQFVSSTFTDQALRSTRIDYINNFPNYLTGTIPQIEKLLADSESGESDPLNDLDRIEYERILDRKDVVAPEYLRAKVQRSNLVFDDTMIIRQGTRDIHLLVLGHGNTEGDVIMWLPDEKVVATGDLVVHPTPYSFNVPPRAWAETLAAVNALGYEFLVPGHGEVQTDMSFVNLNIEAATSVADQRDTLVEEGVAVEEIAERIDLSAFEPRFIGHIPHYKNYFDGYFANPIRAAAVKELSGERMVEIILKEGEE